MHVKESVEIGDETFTTRKGSTASADLETQMNNLRKTVTYNFLAIGGLSGNMDTISFAMCKITDNFEH